MEKANKWWDGGAPPNSFSSPLAQFLSSSSATPLWTNDLRWEEQKEEEDEDEDEPLSLLSYPFCPCPLRHQDRKSRLIGVWWERQFPVLLESPIEATFNFYPLEFTSWPAGGRKGKLMFLNLVIVSFYTVSVSYEQSASAANVKWDMKTASGRSEGGWK